MELLGKMEQIKSRMKLLERNDRHLHQAGWKKMFHDYYTEDIAWCILLR